MLCRYISGENVEQETVKMTVPVLNTVLVEWRDGKRIIYERMCFFIGGKQQASPPTPTDPGVEISDPTGEMIVYVHTFGGYAMKDAVNIREARKFAEVLDKAGEEVDKSVFYTAGYDSPMKFWNRRNEVMFIKKADEIPDVEIN